MTEAEWNSLYYSLTAKYSGYSSISSFLYQEISKSYDIIKKTDNSNIKEIYEIIHYCNNTSGYKEFLEGQNKLIQLEQKLKSIIDAENKQNQPKVDFYVP